MTGRFEIGHQGGQARSHQPAGLNVRRKRGIMDATAAWAPECVSAMLGDASGFLDEFDLLDNARGGLGVRQRAAAARAAVEPMVNDAIDLVRRKSPALVFGMIRLTADLAFVLLAARRAGPRRGLGDVAGRRLGRVGGILARRRQLALGRIAFAPGPVQLAAGVGQLAAGIGQVAFERGDSLQQRLHQRQQFLAGQVVSDSTVHTLNIDQNPPITPDRFMGRERLLIQQLVGIQFRRVTRQEYQLALVGMRRQPFPHALSLVRRVAVRDDDHLAPRVADQTL